MSDTLYRCPACKAVLDRERIFPTAKSFCSKTGRNVRLRPLRDDPAYVDAILLAAAAMGRKGGKSKSERKAKAARANLTKARERKAAKEGDALIEKARARMIRMGKAPGTKGDFSVTMDVVEYRAGWKQLERRIKAEEAKKARATRKKAKV